MQALVIGDLQELRSDLENFKIINISDISLFEESKKSLNMEEPCLLYINSDIRIDDPEIIWSFHKNSRFSAISVMLGKTEMMCSFDPKKTFYEKNRSIYSIGNSFLIKNKKATLHFPTKKIFSVITCVSDQSKYNEILLPSLHKANKFLLDNGLDLFETICLNGSDFNNISEAYNQGISLSNSDIKIFVHEDLDLLEPSWVLKLLQGFSDNSVGLLGLVGSVSPSYEDNWWTSGVRYIYGKQYVGFKENKRLWNWNWDLIPPSGKTGMQVVDGCFMATNRDIKFHVPKNKKYFLTPYEHDLGYQIGQMNLKIGVIKHISYHWAIPKIDTSRIAAPDEIGGMIVEIIK